MTTPRLSEDSLFGSTGKVAHKNRRLILRAAEKEFMTHGYKGASIARIAIESGLPRTNVHYYFSNKLELYGTVLNDIVSLWNDAFSDIKVDDDPREALSAYITAKIDYSQSNPIASRIFASEIIHGAPHLSEYLNSSFKDWITSKAAVIKSWSDQGKIDPIDPMHLLFMIWGATQQYANFGVEVEAALGRPLENKDFDAAKKTITHIILKGLGL